MLIASLPLGFGTRWSLRSLPTQTISQLYETGMNIPGLWETEKVASLCLPHTPCDLHSIRKFCRPLCCGGNFPSLVSSMAGVTQGHSSWAQDSRNLPLYYISIPWLTTPHICCLLQEPTGQRACRDTGRVVLCILQVVLGKATRCCNLNGVSGLNLIFLVR